MICLWNDLTSELILNCRPSPRELWGSQPKKAEDRGKEQELKRKAAEVVICCICLFSTCGLCSLTSIKKPGRSPWREGGDRGYSSEGWPSQQQNMAGKSHSWVWGTAVLAEPWESDQRQPSLWDERAWCAWAARILLLLRNVLSRLNACRYTCALPARRWWHEVIF